MLSKSSTAGQEAWKGFRDELPILLGVIPFGMIYGVLALSAGLTPASAQAMSAVVFAGSAQFFLTQLVDGGTPVLVMILTVFIVNLRHALYSASLAPFVSHLSRGWKLLLAYLLTDEAFAVSIIHYQRAEQKHRHWYFLAAGLTLWSGWQISTAVGIFLGAQIPEAWGLDFSLALTFIALVIASLKDRAAVASALAGGVTAIITLGLPYKLGLVLAAVIGIGAGLWVEEKWSLSG